MASRETPYAPPEQRLFEPYRLIQARHLVGMSRAVVAAKLGVEPWQVLAWEVSTAAPRRDQVERMAAVLGVLPGFFDAGRPMARVDSAGVHICGPRGLTGHYAGWERG